MTDARNKHKCMQNMKCLNYECSLSAMSFLLNYLHVAKENECRRQKRHVSLNEK